MSLLHLPSLHTPPNLQYTARLGGNKLVDHWDVVGASHVGTAPAPSSSPTKHLSSMDWAKTTARRDEKHAGFSIGASYTRCILYIYSNWCNCPINSNTQRRHRQYDWYLMRFFTLCWRCWRKVALYRCRWNLFLERKKKRKKRKKKDWLAVI